MANWQVISLDTTTPQLRAPGTGDGYSFNSGSTQLGVWTTTGLGIGTASPSYSLSVENSSANQLYLRGTGVGFTHASIILSTSTTSLPETRGLGTYMFNEGTDNTFYMGTFYNGSNTWGIGLAAGATFQISAADVTNSKFAVTSTGNVGIGTASPVFKLVVSNAGAQGFEFDPSAGLMQVYNRSTSSYGEFRPYASLMRFFTGSSPTETMRLDASGNLGIGTTSPTKMLELSANNGAGVLNVLRFTDTDTAVTAAQPTGRIEFAENDGGDTTVSAFFEVETVSTSGGGEMKFGTGAAGVAATERMRIDASGNVGIGTTTPGALLDVYSATTSNYVRVGSASTFSAGLSIAANANTHLTSGSLIYQDSSNRLNLLNYANAALRLGTNNTFRVSVPAAGGMVVGTAALATNATDGFLYVPTCAGAPTGTPTAQTGTAPIVIDTTNNKLYFYSGGAWRDAGP